MQSPGQHAVGGQRETVLTVLQEHSHGSTWPSQQRGLELCLEAR